SCKIILLFFFSSRRRHTRSKRDWSSDVCSSDLRAGSTPHLEEVCHGNVLHSHQLDGSGDQKRQRFAQARGRCKKGGQGHRRRPRSEERRVGKECRSRRGRDSCKRKSEEMTREVL